MSGDTTFLVWGAYIMAGLLCAAELGALALRYRSIRQHLCWCSR